MVVVRGFDAEPEPGVPHTPHPVWATPGRSEHDDMGFSDEGGLHGVALRMPLPGFDGKGRARWAARISVECPKASSQTYGQSALRFLCRLLAHRPCHGPRDGRGHPRVQRRRNYVVGGQIFDHDPGDRL